MKKLFNSKGSAHLILIIFLLVGIVASLLLFRQKSHTFKAKATSDQPIAFKALDGTDLLLKDNVPQTSTTKFKITLTSTLGGAKPAPNTTYVAKKYQIPFTPPSGSPTANASGTLVALSIEGKLYINGTLKGLKPNASYILKFCEAPDGYTTTCWGNARGVVANTSGDAVFNNYQVQISSDLTKIVSVEANEELITSTSCGSNSVPACLKGSLASDTSYTAVIIRAWGQAAGGVNPKIRLEDGDIPLATYEVKATTKTGAEFFTYVFPSGAEFRSRPLVRFLNDYYNPPEDRGAGIDYVEVYKGKAQRYQSEEPETYSAGSWDTTSGCGYGYKKQEKLDCEGFFRYDKFVQNPNAYTSHYRVAESQTELDQKTKIDYLAHPTILEYEFKDKVAGFRYIWAEFTDSTGKTDRVSAKINLIGSTKEVKILQLNYIPPDPSNPTNVDPTYTRTNNTIAAVRQHITTHTNSGMEKLREGSRYHGYKDSNAQPSLNYTLFETKEFAKPVPTYPYDPDNTFRVNWSNYEKMLTEDVNICDYVDNQGVQQIWIWSYQVDDGEKITRIFERMARFGKNSFPPSGSYSAWYGIPLPACNKTYHVLNLNYLGLIFGYPNILHVYGHHIEDLWYSADTYTFNKFTKPFGDATQTNRCADIHHTPNNTDISTGQLCSSTAYLACDYNYTSELAVTSDCEDWRPEGTGATQQVTCHTWSGTNCADDGTGSDKTKYYVWWMQNIPGFNNALEVGGKQFIDFWEYLYDFDAAYAKKLSS